MQDLRDQAGAHGHFSANSHRYDSERDALSSAVPNVVRSEAGDGAWLLHLLAVRPEGG
jgi:hypothetical protein